MILAQQRSLCATTFFGSKLFLSISTTSFIYATYFLKVAWTIGKRIFSLFKAPVWISGRCFGVCVDLSVNVMITVVCFCFSFCPRSVGTNCAGVVKDLVED